MFSLLTLLLQIAVILVAARGVGWVFRRFGQPQVVGEMAAGIFLGPSLLGWVAPGLSAALFPPESLGYLNVLSQIGLLLFMFLVGLEFDPRLMRGRGRAAVTTSWVSIVFPFALGAALAVFLYPRLSDPNVPLTGFALFMGAAMSVTAFPVLARILTERNLLRTRLGALTIACAAVDDVTAWAILAVVVAIVRSGATETPVWLTLAGTAVYMAFLIAVVRRALSWLETFYHNRGRLTQDMTAVVLLLLLASAWTTEWLGVHALFGAFALGAVMPKDPNFVHDLGEKLEDVTVIFLLPLFFAFTGLRTSIALVSGAEMWLYSGLILLVAVAGKFGGSTLAARYTALPWREAGALGILMNTRGLMELVILTIGLELGVISQTLFTMMVMMALITTLMTTPVLEWIYPSRMMHANEVREPEDGDTFTALIPVSLPDSGPGLLDAAIELLPPGKQARIYALHLERRSDQSLTRMDKRRLASRDEVLKPLLQHAAARKIQVRPLVFTTGDLGKAVVEIAKARRANLILMGWHKPVIGESMLSGTVGEVIEKADAEVVVLASRAPTPWRKVLALLSRDSRDFGVLSIAETLLQRPGTAKIVLFGGELEPQAQPYPPAGWADELIARNGSKIVDRREAAPDHLRMTSKEADLIVLGVSDERQSLPDWVPDVLDSTDSGVGASFLIVRAADDPRSRSLAATTTATPGGSQPQVQLAD